MRSLRHRGLVVGIVSAFAAGTLVAAFTGSVSAVALTTGATAPAGSTSNPICTPARFQAGQQLVEQELSNRVTQLQTLGTRVSNTKAIPSADASTLTAIVSAEQTGITDGGIEGLRAVVAGASTCAELISDAKTMVVQFWVYALVSPQVDLTAVASVESAIISRAVAIEPTIASAIAAAVNRGESVQGAEAAYSDLKAKVSAAQAAVQEVSIPNLLTQEPNNFPGDAAILVGYHNDVVGAGADLRGAYSDLRTIVADLK